MKKLIVSFFLVLVSSSAFSATTPSMAFTQMLLNKDMKDSNDLFYVTNRYLDSWCSGSGSPLSIANFEAASRIDALADGLYRCNGKFVQVTGDHSIPVQIFQLDSCTAVNQIELKATCPTR